MGNEELCCPKKHNLKQDEVGRIRGRKYNNQDEVYVMFYSYFLFMTFRKDMRPYKSCYIYLLSFSDIINKVWIHFLLFDILWIFLFSFRSIASTHERRFRYLHFIFRGSQKFLTLFWFWFNHLFQRKEAEVNLLHIAN